ncbi:MAG: hypothetical protein HY537_02615 [Deltaproteobacteria bacterium]|nr:hypothetical protein [Deltaproteobacteria bacterium]
MKAILIVFLSVCAFAGPYCGHPIHKPLIFKGHFTFISASSPECKTLLSENQYEAKHFQMGPTGTLSVLHLVGEGALSGITMVGLLGPDCDFSGDKDVIVDEMKRHIHVEGLVNRSILWFEMRLDDFQSGEKICKVRAEFTGSPAQR